MYGVAKKIIATPFIMLYNIRKGSGYMSQFFQYLLNGLSTGSIYALVALGYTMVYGIIKLINFAHGDIIMVGAFVALGSTNILLSIGLPPALCVIITMVATGALGFFTEKLAYKPLRKAKRITALITAIAISFLLENLFAIIFSNRDKQSPTIIDFGSITIGGVAIQWKFIIIILLLVVATTALTLFVNRTRSGKAMKAVSENPDTASLMGINVDATISTTFVIGAALAGLASVMYVIYYPGFNNMLGSGLGIKAFVAAVLGGIGLIPGAVLGGLIIGVIENMCIAYIGSKWVDVITFSILIFILLVKPSGILGKNTKEKV